MISIVMQVMLTVVRDGASALNLKIILGDERDGGNRGNPGGTRRMLPWARSSR